LIQSTCMKNLTILASAVPEISLGTSKYEVGQVTLVMLLLKVICHAYAEIDIAYMYAKFDHFSFSRSEEMVGAPKI